MASGGTDWANQGLWLAVATGAGWVIREAFGFYFKLKNHRLAQDRQEFRKEMTTAEHNKKGWDDCEERFERMRRERTQQALDDERKAKDKENEIAELRNRLDGHETIITELRTFIVTKIEPEPPHEPEARP
jgi:hypothetical protein